MYFILKIKYKRKGVEIIELEKDIKEVEEKSSEEIIFTKEKREEKSDNIIKKAINT